MTSLHDVSPDRLWENIREVLKRWHDVPAGESPLAGLHLLQHAFFREHTVREATHSVVERGLAALAATYERDAEVLRMRFIEGLPAYEVAGRLDLAESTIYKIQRTALRRLADVIYTQEQQFRARGAGVLDERLGPPPYERLFGVEASLQDLLDTVRPGEPPWLISIEGLGGIGKTSLADALVRRAVTQGIVHAVGWVSAKERIFHLDGYTQEVEAPALTVDALVEALLLQFLDDVSPSSLTQDEALRTLRRHLRDEPRLIVIDNLETVQDYQHLLPLLRRLVEPSTFLLTSRKSLYSEPDVYPFTVPELEERDALRLIRHEASLRNRSDLANCTDASLHSIYETVGGNPLALRLIVGQAYVHALDAILDDLTAARGQTVDALYTYIYRRAWDALDEPARRTLLAMPLVTDRGGRLDYLTEVSGVAPAHVRAALDDLVALNLVDVRGTIDDRRYAIHALTRAFLQEQVAKWQ